MKYRILEKNGSFMPQRRTWGIWINFDDNYAGYDMSLIYGSLEAARRFLDLVISFKRTASGYPINPPDKTIIHSYP